MTKQPVWKTRAGSVVLALWDNEVTVNGRSVTMLKATIERRFKDGQGNWKSSGSFSRNEVPAAIVCLARAYDRMMGEEQDDNAVPEEAVR